MKMCERCGAANQDDAALCSLCYETFPVVDAPAACFYVERLKVEDKVYE